jgi:glyoxylase-like metal-dependent hydrolase (beta-lactamase superfamily II)/8-oxo-dGTP pyrophosphatase MutT (NUDIX family)
MASPAVGPGLYERVLAAAGGTLPPARKPRASAAVVPWRRREADGRLEVWWIRRGRQLPFMGGWHAFPGGTLDAEDQKLPLKGRPGNVAAESRTPGLPDQDALPADPDLAPGIAACGARELFEEAGILLGPASRTPSMEAFRRACLDRTVEFSKGLSESGWRLDASRLVFAGRWLTPPFGAMRFDNRFFLLEWRAEDGEPSALPPENDGGEWIEPARALERAAAGDALAAPPILHLLRVLAEDGPERGRPRLLDTREADLGPMRRIELRPGVLLLPLAAATLPPASHVNTFLLGGGEAVLVDPGSPFPAENAKLLAALEAAGARLGRRVVEIWLTHHHPDHVAGVETVRRALGVRVAAHPATAERLAARGLAVDRALADGDRLGLEGGSGFELVVHHTPGHARGHVAIEVAPGRDLIAGDLVAGFGTIVIDPPEGDMDEYLASLERMRGRGFRTLFPAHGAPVLDVDGKLAEYLAHRLAREREVLACWRSGLRAPREMLAAVYPEVPAAAQPLAERQIVAHLERLERRGELRVDGSHADTMTSPK